MDRKITQLLVEEERRQAETINLIPSENYPSKDVRALLGSVFTSKYSEGYPGRRYYQGNKIVDEVERLAIDRAKKLFKVPHANVQPYSGSPANMAVLFALCEPFGSAQGVPDTIMGMELASGGHLTHGHPKITFSGKYFNSVQFGVNRQGLVDYDTVEKLALKVRPRLLLIGTTAYSRVLDWQKFGEIASKVGAYLIADIAHVAGLVIGGVYPSPVPYAHVVTTTTHKTLRGPRGAMIMVTDKGIDKDKELPVKIDRAVFPGLQGGPHDNVTAAIAQCLYEAEKPAFKKYARRVVENAQILADVLQRGGPPATPERSDGGQGLTLVSGGTDSHLMLIDLRPLGLSGNVVAEALEVAGIVVNRNSVPGDTSPFYPSGIRLGTPAATSRGMREDQMITIGEWILDVIEHVKGKTLPSDLEGRQKFLKEYKSRVQKDKFLRKINREVVKLCKKFPISF